MEEELNKRIGLVLLLASLVAASVIPITIAYTYTVNQTISCTVTAGSYSVSLDRTSVNYGEMAQGDSMTDPEGAINATNNGGLKEDFLIRGTNATGTGQNPPIWTIAASCDCDTYKHAFIVGETETSLHTNNQKLADDVANGGTQEFTLKLYAPTLITFKDTYSFQVIVTAVAPEPE